MVNATENKMAYRGFTESETQFINKCAADVVQKRYHITNDVVSGHSFVCIYVKGNRAEQDQVCRNLHSGLKVILQTGPKRAGHYVIAFTRAI